MLQNIEILGFRCFKEYKLSNLTPVNLFVGRNSAGKTSALEAISLLVNPNPLSGLFDILDARNEKSIYQVNRSSSARDEEYFIKHIFYNHEIQPLSRVSVASYGAKRGVTLEILKATSDRPLKLDVFLTEGVRRQDYIESGPLLHIFMIPGDDPHNKFPALIITQSGGIVIEERGYLKKYLQQASKKAGVLFLSPHRFDEDLPFRFWNNITLTPEEDKVRDMVAIIEPRIEQIGLIQDFQDRFVQSNFYVRLKDIPLRVPIGTMGDGLNQLFLIALHMFNSKNGCVFFDEIDTGLHYSVMVNMWKAIVEASKRFNIQVFATTHSSDCIEALARLFREDQEIRDIVSLHRIDKDQKTSTRYSAEEIDVAARHGMDLR